MKRKTLIPIGNLWLILLGITSFYQYNEYKANVKYKKERDIILDKMRDYK